MKHITTLFVATVAAIGLAPAEGSAAGKKHGHCPPGLAKKNPPCVPPGLAKKGVRAGDYYYDHDHIVIGHPDRYGLDSRFGWYRIGDNIVVRTDRETGEILELVDAIAAVLD